MYEKALEIKETYGREFVSSSRNVGVPVIAPWLMNPTSIHENAGSIPGLA